MAQYKINDIIAGEYLVKDVFGGKDKSGMGVVYLVKARDERLIVLKTFQEINLLSELGKRFIKEAEAWTNIGIHPNIVEAYWVREISNQLFIAAEYIQPDENGRKTLLDYLGYGTVPSPSIIKWATQFCYGMRHANRNGILSHRDIKPSNLMIDRYGKLKISDFGLVRFEYDILLPPNKNNIHTAQSDAKTDAILGTLPYMAPEQYVDFDNVDQRSDIYSFGVILFQLITGGHLPFYVDNKSNNIIVDYYNQHLKSRVPTIKHEFKSIILKCLEKDKKNRYQTYDDFLEDIETIAKKEKCTLPKDEYQKDNDIEKHFVLACSYSSLGKPDNALEEINIYLSIEPNDVAALIEKGRILKEFFNKTEESIAITFKAVEIEPTNSVAWNNLGLCYGELGKIDKSINAFDKAIECDPGDTGVLINLSNLYVKNGKPKNAIDILNRALKINPNKPSILLNLGSAYKSLNDVNKAINYFEKALEVNPLLPEAWLSLAYIFYEKNDSRKAIEILQKGKNQNPNDINIIMQLCEYLNTTGKQKEATDIFIGAEEILKFNSNKYPNNPMNWQNLGILYMGKKDVDKALNCFEHVEKLESNNGFVILNIAKIYFFEKKRAKETVFYCDKLISLRHELEQAISMKAQALSFVGYYKEAVAQVNEYLYLHPDYEPLWFLLSGIHEYHENFKDAYKCAEICKKILLSAKIINKHSLGEVESKLNVLMKKMQIIL